MFIIAAKKPKNGHTDKRAIAIDSGIRARTDGGAKYTNANTKAPEITNRSKKTAKPLANPSCCLEYTLKSYLISGISPATDMRRFQYGPRDGLATIFIDSSSQTRYKHWF